jgi:hypothetical protein
MKLEEERLRACRRSTAILRQSASNLWGQRILPVVTIKHERNNLGATGFEPATCRRGDRSIEKSQVHRDRDLSCNGVLSRSLHPAWRTPRYELATMGYRAWLPWCLLHYAGVSARLGLRTTPHTAVLSFGFARHNSKT